MYKLSFCVVIILLLTGLYAQSQTIYHMGLTMDDEEYRKAPHASENIQLEDGRRSMQSEADLSAYCPEIRFQGEIASCVGWSLGYGAMTMERAMKNGWTDQGVISENANSALFIYNQISRGECQKGISLVSAMELLQDKGNCLAKEFDFDVNDCNRNVPEKLLQKASDYRIADYIRLFPLDAEPEEKIKRIRLVLAQNKPVVVGMKVLQNFYDIRKGDETWWPKFGNTTYAGGHAMVIVGYDDNKYRHPTQKMPPEERGAFKLMNSWGKNWGNNGFIWIRYGDFANYCRYAFTLMLEEGAPIQLDSMPQTTDQVAEHTEAPDPEPSVRELVRMAGSFGFRQYTGWEYGPVFKEAGVEAEGSEYRLQGDWKIGDQFQLYTKSDFDNGYIYVLSIDPQRKAQVHFPRSEEYNNKFEDENESALIITGGSVLTIPNQESVLKLSRPGMEHLVVLFSTKKIKADYIKILGVELAKHKDNLIRHLHTMLDRFMVPLSDITYQKDQMGFEVSTRSEGKIVPIVLTVKVSG
ncbi:MAG: C1 family peptidase [Saprospiraceae bacterium]|nr:DUF4384 domain-containing protein [Lewinella sp.]